MALKGLDIFKLTPKTNCKDCGNPTCMAFSMKVAQGAISADKCPHMSPEALAKLNEATEPPMKTIDVGGHKLGGETVLLRHEKTFVNRNVFSVKLTAGMTDAEVDAVLDELKAVDYERINERMYAECVCVECGEDAARASALIEKARVSGRALIVKTRDPELAASAKAALVVGADASNWEAMNEAAKAAGSVLGVSGETLAELHDTVEKLEAAGNKNLVLDLGTGEAFKRAVQIRRAALKDGDRTFGYPSFVDTAAIAPGDPVLQSQFAALFVCRYGSVIVMDRMTYAQALPLFGLRQNIFTDPQKPMKVAPGVYPLNGAGPDSPCAVTVDFALTYFVVSGELERSGMPVNLCITDAGGYSVLTSWAAGKFSANSIAAFFAEQDLENKLSTRTLILPGKVAVLKGEVENKLPGWNVLVAPNEAVQLVKYMRELKI